jgi:hypothetical protein
VARLLLFNGVPLLSNIFKAQRFNVILLRQSPSQQRKTKQLLILVMRVDLEWPQTGSYPAIYIRHASPFKRKQVKI